MPTCKKTMLRTGIALLAIACAAPAFAHPHVFAEARLDVNVDDQGNIASLHHVWRFDDLFSSTVLVEFDKNQDLALSQEELDEVAGVVHASLGDFNYFQLVTRNGKDVAMEAPDRLIADFVDNQLIILFESKPEAPLALDGKISLGVYDPTFYTAIDFIEDSYMTVNNLPAGCTQSVVRPDPDEALAQNQQTLTEAFFEDPTGNDMSKIFATRLEIACNKDS